MKEQDDDDTKFSGRQTSLSRVLTWVLFIYAFVIF